MVSMNNWILSLKLLLISAAVAVGLRFSVPIAVDGIPATWSLVLSWLKPPYLYLIINGIIITIAASSRLHHRRSDSPPHRSLSIPAESFESFSAHPDIIEAEIEDAKGVKEVDLDSEEAVAEDGDVFVDWALKRAPEEILELESRFPEILELESNFPAREEIVELESHIPEIVELAREKPLVRSRFGQRKAIRSTGEGGKALGVARAKKQETLESTWKMITEGRHVPLNRHLKQEEVKIGKEASQGQEELNRRVEAFINKFNEEMRIQRQESMKQYMEMINRGV